MGLSLPTGQNPVTGTDDATKQVSVAELNHIFNLLPHVSPDDYGTNTTPGTTDMSAAFTSALAAVADGGVLYMGDGPYYLATPVVLPVRATNRVRIVGNGNTIIKPLTSAFIHSTASAVCQNIEFGHVIVDGSAMTGRSTVFGSRYAGAPTGQSNDWSDIHIHDLDIRDVPTDTTYPGSPTNDVWPITILNWGTATSGRYIKNILVERVKVDGANGCVFVYTLGGATINSTIDNVTIRDCSHYAYKHTSMYYANSYQVGSWATTGKVTIDNCYSEETPDNGIELNNCRDAVVTKCSFKNSGTAGIYVRDYNSTLTEVHRNRYVFRDIKVLCDDVNIKTQGIGIGDTASSGYGEILVDGFHYSTVNPQQSYNGYAFFIASSDVVERITLRNVFIDYVLNDEIGWNQSIIPVRLTVTGGGTHLLDNIHMRASGTVTDTGSYGVYFRGLWLDGTASFIVRNSTLNYSAVHDAGTVQFLFLGNASGSVIDVKVDNCKAASSTTTLDPISISNTVTLLYGAALNSSSTTVTSNSFAVE